MVSFLILSYGFYTLFCGIFKIQTSNLHKYFNSEKKGISMILEDFIINFANKLSKYIRFEEFKRKKIVKSLNTAGINEKPEYYYSYGIIGLIIYLGISIFMYILIGGIIGIFLLALIIFLGIKWYFNHINKPIELIKEKVNLIEREAYNFCLTVEQELKNNRDVIKILENYKSIAGETFKKELDILITDMRSMSYEIGLENFSNRLNSSKISDIVQGLLGVIRGDDNTVYFQLLISEFKEFELNRLRKEAQKIPQKVVKFSVVLMLCFLFLLGTVFGIGMGQNMGKMFG